MSTRSLLRTLRVPACTGQIFYAENPVHKAITPVLVNQVRPLLTPADPPNPRTLGEVVSALSGIIGGPSTYDPELYNKRRQELVDILPARQSDLPARRMLDSYDSAIIPIGSDPSLRDRYLTHHGGVRIGRLLEDMDIFAVHLGWYHFVL